MTDAYQAFLARKAIIDVPTGITDGYDIPSFMFDHQADIVRWALRRGRAAIFAGTGLGKTAMELVWADIVRAHTGKPVLVFAPLAVAQQHIREAAKFGITANIASCAADVTPGINVTNYQKMDKFDLSIFGGVVLDESSILKNTVGHYRTQLIEQCASIPFRLAATATPAPNDFMELGNHSEFLGIMSYTDMLATFFAHDGGETQKWRLKGHDENDFWKWMASWSVMLRKPSDLGYANDGYDLPELTYQHHTVMASDGPSMDTGMLFAMEAQTMQERIKARRDTVSARVAFAASITPAEGPFVWWCNLNSESERLAKAIPGAVEVRGSDIEDAKERKLIDFSEGRIRVLVSKASICGFGMNWQHCSNTGFVGLNDSFEQVYQAVRRFWRFGQTNQVTAHFIAADTEGAVIANLRRKEEDADRMAAAMVMHTSALSSNNIRGSAREKPDYNPTHMMRVPSWIAA